jgi:hypothetical protein
MTDGKAYLQLGRNGDIYSMLPILYYEYCTTGQKPTLIVGMEFARAISQIGWINKVEWPESWINLAGAIRWAKQRYYPVCVASVFGAEFPILYKCPSFQLEHWRRCGYLNQWGELPMPEVERTEHVALPAKPYVLFADHSMSSPFPFRDEVVKVIRDTLPEYDVIRLSHVRAPTPTDLLSLYDNAAAIVVIDTMHLHLSVCTAAPVLAFNTNSPHRSNGSAYHTRFRFMCRYADVQARMGEFKQSLLDAVAGRRHDPQLVHVWSHGNQGSNPFDEKTDAGKRMSLARKTWDIENQHNRWVDFRYYANGKTAQDIGDKRALPLINDMLDAAAKGRHHKDIIVISNSDTCFAPGLTKMITDWVGRKGSVYAHRWDFGKLDNPLTNDEIKTGHFYPGCDLFAFEVGWWLNYRGDAKNVYLGAEWWDCLFRNLVKQTGGGELLYSIYHQRHQSFWESNKDSPSNKHNARECREFLGQWGLRD